MNEHDPYSDLFLLRDNLCKKIFICNLYHVNLVDGYQFIDLHSMFLSCLILTVEALDYFSLIFLFLCFCCIVFLFPTYNHILDLCIHSEDDQVVVSFYCFTFLFSLRFDSLFIMIFKLRANFIF